MSKNILVGQSGGPTAVINASLTASSKKLLHIVTRPDMFTAWSMVSKVFFPDM